MKRLISWAIWASKQRAAVKTTFTSSFILILTVGLMACGETGNSPTSAVQVTTSTTVAAAAITSPATTTSAAPNSVAVLPTVTVLPTFTPTSTTISEAATPASTSVATTLANTSPPSGNTPPSLDSTNVASAATTPATSNPTDTTSTATVAAIPTSSNATGKLAYLENGNLYIYDLNNQTKKLMYQATGISGLVGIPAWSPDGSRLVLTLKDVAKDNTSRSNLYILKLTGGEPQRIAVSGLVATCEENPVWSPDGRTIAFTEVLDPDRKNVFNETNAREVWLVDANGQNPRTLAEGLEPAWSADSSSIAYVTNGSLKAAANFRQNNAIHLIKVSNKSDREIFAMPKVPSDLSKYGYPADPNTFYLQYPVFLNNDKVIGFTTLGHGGLVITINNNGGDFKLWDTNYEGGFARTYSDPTKGSRLMYEALPASGILHVNIIDTNSTPLPLRVDKVQFGGERIKESALSPSWSPDGSLVAYLYAGSDGGSVRSLAIATSQATKPQTLLKGAITAVAWSR